MYKAKAEDKAWVVNVLSAAFENNLSINYIVRQDVNRKKRIKFLMEYSFNICLLFGEIWLSEDRQACGMILYPENKRTTLYTLWLDLKLVFKAVGLTGLWKVLKRESLIQAKQPTVRMSYLWFIGVSPTNQQRGIGSRLFKDILKHSRQKNLAVYLETSTLENIHWYEHFGFKIYDKLELSYTLYFLSNEQG